MRLPSPSHRRVALGLALALAASAVGQAQESGEVPAAPILPGIGAHDARVRIDPDAPPWRALGKLQASGVSLRSACTGALVGPATVLTAAHCLYDIRTHRFFPPTALHFLLGYDGGHYQGHALVRRVITGAGYDPARPQASFGSDWALLALDRKLGAPDRVLAISAAPPAIGATVMIAGYSQDHPLFLTGDLRCRIIGRVADAAGRPLLRHNCTATHGVSGAPVLVREDGAWRIGAVDVAAEMGVASGVAALLGEAQARLAASEAARSDAAEGMP